MQSEEDLWHFVTDFYPARTPESPHSCAVIFSLRAEGVHIAENGTTRVEDG